MSNHSDSVSDILLHPDALHCLKRKQLENLCNRLDLKATGKKDELIARLEGYASAKVALEGSSSIGKIVSARPRTRSTTESSATSMSTSEAISEAVLEKGERDIEMECNMEVLPEAGPSIRLITHQVEEERGEEEMQECTGEGDVSNRTVTIPRVKEESLPVSSSTKSIYPWKRIVSSSSLSKRLRSSSSNSTLSSKADSLPNDQPMTMNEFGGAARVNSIGSLKRWLSRSSSSSSLLKRAEVEEKEIGTTSKPPALSSSPLTKRKRDSIRDVEVPLSPPVETPVRRAIKNRPSRAVKTISTPPNLYSPTSVSKADFTAAATKVLEEMNARLAQNGKPSMLQLPTIEARSISNSMKPPASPLKSINSRTKERFSGQHAKHFGQMESIASHYAAKRVELATREWNGSASAKSTSSASGSALTSKRIKIDERAKERITEERAVLQRKIDLAKQRRKSGARRVSMGRKSGGIAPRVGFKSKITGAVRDFVGAASKMANGEGRSALPVAIPPRSSSADKGISRIVKPLPSIPSIPARATTASSSISNTLRQPKSKPAFDLQASLARRPIGYKPYSAKETVQLLQADAAIPQSPIKTASDATTSPIRNDWTMIAAQQQQRQPAKRVVSSSSTVAFPCLSPGKESQPLKVIQQNTSPQDKVKIEVDAKAAPRRNTTINSVTAGSSKKTRSSISAARQGLLQADRLKRISKLNESKHQASMAVKRKQVVAVQKAIERNEKIKAASAIIPTGTGRGTPRKASTKLEMAGLGRGEAAIKRLS